MLLAKFLAANSNNIIFSKIYSYAPDNLAWLWAFIDWESEIKFDDIPTQDYYQPIDINYNLYDNMHII